MKRMLQRHYVKVSTVGEKAQAMGPSQLPPRPPIGLAPELSGVVWEITA